MIDDIHVRIDKPRVGHSPADGGQRAPPRQTELPVGTETYPRSNGARLLPAIPGIRRLSAAPGERQTNYHDHSRREVAQQTENGRRLEMTGTCRALVAPMRYGLVRHNRAFGVRKTARGCPAWRDSM